MGNLRNERSSPKEKGLRFLLLYPIIMVRRSKINGGTVNQNKEASIFLRPFTFIKLFVFSFLLFMDGNILAKKRLAFIFQKNFEKEVQKLANQNDDISRSPASLSSSPTPQK